MLTAVEGGSVGLALLLALIYLIYGFFCLYLLVQMVLRLALIDLLLVLAPAAMGLWILPHSSGWSRHWLRLFATTVFQQAVQLIALALGIGFLSELAPIGLFEPAQDLIWKLLMSLAFIYLATRVPSMLGNSSPFDAWLQTLWFGLSLPATMVRSVASVAAIGAGGGAAAGKALSSGGGGGSSGVGGATRSAAELSTPQGGPESVRPRPPEPERIADPRVPGQGPKAKENCHVLISFSSPTGTQHKPHRPAPSAGQVPGKERNSWMT